MEKEWISIKDKLPEYNKKVLVCRPNQYSGNIDILIATLHQKVEQGRSYGMSDMRGSYKNTYNDYWSFPSIQLLNHITYWMPLPEPKV